MLEFKNIQLQCTSKIFTKQSRKLIRFSYSTYHNMKENSITTSKSTNTFINEATIKWQQSLKIPQVYNQDIDFQIYNEHQFGYNPQELHNLLYGTVRVMDNKTICKCQVFNASDKDKKIGYLMLDVKKLVKKASKQSALNQTAKFKTTKVITSILVRNVKNSPQGGYIVFKHDRNNFKSQVVESIQGQFLFSLVQKNDKYLVKQTDLNELLTVGFYQADGKLIGKSVYAFKNDKKLVKVDLEDQFDDKKVGEMYFETETLQLHVEPKKDVNKQPKPASEFKQQKQIKQSKQVVQRQSQRSPEPKASDSRLTLSKIRTLSLTRLSSLGQSQFLGTLRRKRMSVIHNNGDVVMGSQRRFQSYQDKQTNVISYSRLPNMKFQQQHSHKYYKGASIGVGNKSDFTLYYKQNPGVGHYKLPSIFDRY